MDRTLSNPISDVATTAACRTPKRRSQRFLDGWLRGTNLSWLIFDCETGALAAPRLAERMKQDSTSVFAGPAYWGRGLMAEAIEAVVDWAFPTSPFFGLGGLRLRERVLARVLERLDSSAKGCFGNGRSTRMFRDSAGLLLLRPDSAN